MKIFQNKALRTVVNTALILSLIFLMLPLNSFVLKADSSGQICSFDGELGGGETNDFAFNTSDMTEGSASARLYLTATANKQYRYAGTIAPIDISSLKNDGVITFMIKISGQTSVLSGQKIQIVLTSDGKDPLAPDTDNYISLSYDPSTITQGVWTKVTVDYNSLEKFGSMNYSAVNYIKATVRTSRNTALDTPLDISFDDLRFEGGQETVYIPEGQGKKEDTIFDFDTLLQPAGMGFDLETTNQKAGNGASIFSVPASTSTVNNLQGKLYKAANAEKLAENGGQIYFWVKISDKSLIGNETNNIGIRIMLTSDGKAPNTWGAGENFIYYNWTPPAAMNNNEWFKATIDLSSFGKIGNLNLAKIDYLHIQIGTKASPSPFTVLLDDMGFKCDEPYVPVPPGQGKMEDSIYNFDKALMPPASGFNHETSDVKEGSGACIYDVPNAYATVSNLLGKIDTVNAEKLENGGKISFWFKVSNKTYLGNAAGDICVRLMISSDGKAPNTWGSEENFIYYNWTPDASFQNNVWTLVEIDYAEFKHVGNINLSAINYLQIQFGTKVSQEPFSFLFDDLRFKANEPPENIPKEIYPDGTQVIDIEEFDKNNGGQSFDYKNKKEGIACATVKGTGATIDFSNKALNLDLSLLDNIQRNTYIEFWLFINNPASMPTLSFELNSSGDYDKAEWQVDIDPVTFKAGWQKIRIKNTAGTRRSTDSTSYNPAKTTFMRIFFVGLPQNRVVKIDAMKLVSYEPGYIPIDFPEPPVLQSENVFSFDDLSVSTENNENASTNSTAMTEGDGCLEVQIKSAGSTGKTELFGIIPKANAIHLERYKGYFTLKFWADNINALKLDASSNPLVTFTISSNAYPEDLSSIDDSITWTLNASDIAALKEKQWNTIRFDTDKAKENGSFYLGGIQYLYINIKHKTDIDTFIRIDDLRAYANDPPKLAKNMICEFDEHLPIPPGRGMSIKNEGPRGAGDTSLYFETPPSTDAGVMWYQGAIIPADVTEMYNGGKFLMDVKTNNPERINATGPLMIRLIMLSSGKESGDVWNDDSKIAYWVVSPTKLKANEWCVLEFTLENMSKIGEFDYSNINFLEIQVDILAGNSTFNISFANLRADPVPELPNSNFKYNKKDRSLGFDGSGKKINFKTGAGIKKAAAGLTRAFQSIGLFDVGENTAAALWMRSALIALIWIMLYKFNRKYFVQKQYFK